MTKKMDQKNSNEIIPIVPPQLPEHKSWWARHIMAEILALVFVMALGALGYYYYQNSGKTLPGNDDNGQVCIQVIQKARNIQTGEIRDFPTPCDVPAGWEPIQPEAIEMSEWKTYRNDEYGFEFKYPHEWGQKVINGNVYFYDTRNLPESDSGVFSVEIKENSYPGLMAKEWFNKEYDNGFKFPFELDFVEFGQIADKSMVKYLVREELGGTRLHIIVPLNTNILEITHNRSSDLENLYTKVLSTFKFTKTHELPAEIISNPTFVSWFNQKQLSYGSDMTSFSEGETKPLKATSSQNADCVIQGAGDKAIASPDGKSVVCIYFGNEPDSELFLINKTTGKSSTLLTCGTICTYENGFWLDNARFVFLETDLDIDYTDNNYDIYTFKVIQFNFAKNTSTGWTSTLRIRR